MQTISVLYVEDDFTLVEYVTKLLLRHNCIHYKHASNGTEAFYLYQKQKFDLVITDIIMPKMNGFELIKKIKELNSHQLIMIMTSLNNKEDLITAIKLRIHYFIEKPINSKIFNNTIEECIEKIHQKKEARLLNLLLEQYKYAIDESTILSKTDIKGRITYANQAFYNISQYTQEECIGCTHNIVKHPDSNPKLFKNIWKTISSKKEWRGIIKNRAKDGSEYIVDCLLLPLVDTENKIIEYLGIRHDITKFEHYKNDLKIQLDLAVKDIVDTQKEVVFTMGAIGETRSKETGFHVKRVAEYSYLLAKLSGLDEESAELLKLASPMHDIGKVGIPDAILNKPGKLTVDEFEIMKTHSALGYEMLKGSTRDIMKTSAIVAYEHHEKWDGTGYPRGLKKDNIHIYGRITAVCDVFDALGSDRCYKKAWKLDKILELFKSEKGKHFDPLLIELFFDNLNQFLEIRDRYVD
ncbi:response regulator [Arcobacteraceae bacterium]|nr:response regulator [Arcobacteraceae bacterium]